MLQPDLIDQIAPHWMRDIGAVLSPIAAATVALLFLPTPDKLAELLTLSTPPRAYIIFYNLVRYVATLHYRAAWQPNRNGNGDPNAKPTP